MANISAKAGSNVFYKARSEASAHNNRLSSREGAADEMSIDRGRLFRIETGIAVPYPEEVIMMSRLYCKPELENYYCSKCCPLGYDTKEVKVGDIDRITVEAIAALRRVENVKNLIIDIAEDGEVSNDEVDKFKEIMSRLEGVSDVAEEMKLWARKNL